MGVDLSKYTFIPKYGNRPGPDGTYPSGRWDNCAVEYDSGRVGLRGRRLWAQTVAPLEDLGKVLGESAIPGETEVIALMVGDNNIFVRCYGAVEELNDAA